MQQYLNLLETILENGEKRDDRTGTGTLSVFGHQMRFDLRQGFPLVTTKKLHLRSIIHELLWFLKGDTNLKYLRDNKVTIWDEWADKDGNLGPVYGYQWRSWGKEWLPNSRNQDDSNSGIDQIKYLIDGIKKNPHSRRHIVSAWNVADVNKMALPPCHVMFQFYVHNDKRLSCQLYQRSADSFLGVPFNIASYSLLVHMVAHVCGLTVGDFVHTIGDAHLYLNHMDQAKMQITRDTKPLPQLIIKRNVESIFDFVYEDFEIVNYESHPAIKAEISV